MQSAGSTKAYTKPKTLNCCYVTVSNVKTSRQKLINSVKALAVGVRMYCTWKSGKTTGILVDLPTT